MWPCIPFQWIDWIRVVKRDVPESTINCMNQLFRQCQSLGEACKYLFVKGALDNLKTQITLRKVENSIRVAQLRALCTFIDIWPVHDTR